MKYFLPLLLLSGFAFAEDPSEHPSKYEVQKLYSQYCELFRDQYGKYYLDFSSVYNQPPCYYEIEWKGHSGNCPTHGNHQPPQQN